MNLYIILFIISGSVFGWLFFLTFLLIKTIKHYQHLTHGVKKQTLQDALEQIMAKQAKLSKDADLSNARIDALEHAGNYHLQKLGFRRFNPFEDTGGDQSFALSLLDNFNNGIVFTFLHSRDTTRVYAKQVIKGKSDNFPLSKEEEDVIAATGHAKI